MNNGKFVQIDSPYDIYYHPKNIFVADFFGTLGMNFIYGYVKDRKFYFDDYVMELQNFAGKDLLQELTAESRLILGIRPESISFSTKPTRSGIKAKVDLIQRFPPSVNIICRIKNYVINVLCFIKDLSGVYQDMDIYLVFNSSKIFLFYHSSGELITPAF